MISTLSIQFNRITPHVQVRLINLTNILLVPSSIECSYCCLRFEFLPLNSVPFKADTALDLDILGPAEDLVGGRSGGEESRRGRGRGRQKGVGRVQRG